MLGYDWSGISTIDRVWIRLLLFTDAVYPWHLWPWPFAIIALVLRRTQLSRYNLKYAGGRNRPEIGGVDAHRFTRMQACTAATLPARHAPRSLTRLWAPVSARRPGLAAPRSRTPSNQRALDAGARYTPFGRNTTQVPAPDVDALSPPPEHVAQALLARSPDAPTAGAAFNMLAAAWVQLQVHDWMDHELERGPMRGELSRGAEFGCPLAAFRFPETASSPLLEPDTHEQATGFRYHLNTRTAWWDASAVYGTTPAQMRRTRTFEGGEVVELALTGVLPSGRAPHEGAPTCAGLGSDPGLIFMAGDQLNSYLGVVLLQSLFLKEHNRVARAIVAAHPRWSDETVFQRARITVAAIQAKIHTIDWTRALLNTKTLDIGMRANWYGLLGKTIKERFGLHTGVRLLSGVVGLPKGPTDHGVAYSFTEDFAAVRAPSPMAAPAINDCSCEHPICHHSLPCRHA